MQQSRAIQVSVVVPCRNEIRHIHAFLDSVFHQELGEIEMEVLVAEGMSKDGTRRVIGDFKRNFQLSEFSIIRNKSFPRD